MESQQGRDYLDMLLEKQRLLSRTFEEEKRRMAIVDQFLEDMGYDPTSSS